MESNEVNKINYEGNNFMANRWEKFNGVSSKLLDILDDMNDKVKVKLDKAEGDDKRSQSGP